MPPHRADAATPDPRAARIERLLRERFSPRALAVENDSARHAGHAGAREAGAERGQTHYNVSITSAEFAGMTRVARSRAVHEALAPEFASGLHALSLRLAVPEE